MDSSGWHGGGSDSGNVEIGRSSNVNEGWPAHPFAVAEAAAQRAALSGEDACIAVLGESGSGKTEVCKLVLLHLLNLPRSVIHAYHTVDAGLAELGVPAHRALGLATLLSRSVLEAFTHAAAPTNANASRCVLATQLTLSADGGFVVGARLLPMLLQSGRAGRMARAHWAMATSMLSTPRRPPPPSRNSVGCIRISCDCWRLQVHDVRRWVRRAARASRPSARRCADWA